MTLIYFILILGITIMIHELGHFIFAKRAGAHVYEFSLGMGPRLFKFNRKNDETDYSIRLFPIGGYVSIAGEDMEENNIPKEKQLVNKTWKERFLTLAAGVTFNFLLAIILLFVIGLVNGNNIHEATIDTITKGYALEDTNIVSGDVITKINNKKISNQDDLLLMLTVYQGEEISLEIRHKNGELESYKLAPTKVEEDEKTSYIYGFTLVNKSEKGFLEAIKYTFLKTTSLIKQMGNTILFLVTGKLSLNNLSGPIGIYNVVGEVSKTGLLNVLYLIAYLCINVGFLNFLPLPAFDGGRILFLIIEKIKGSRVKPEIENMIHTIGFLFLMILMIIVSYNDIIRLFH